MENKTSRYLLAGFDSPDALVHAAGKLQDSGFSKYDAHSPFPIHGLPEVMKLKDSPLGWLVIMTAIFTVLSVGGFFIWASYDYPTTHSGKPAMTWETMVAPVWEITMIASGTAVLVGMILLCGLPLMYHPLFKSARFAKATDDGFFISVDSSDPKFQADSTRKLLEELGGKNLELIEDSEPQKVAAH